MDGAKGEMTRSPFGLTCRRPCTSDTAVPSDKDHHIRTGGAPATLHVTTVPESLRKCTLVEGSNRNLGPDRRRRPAEEDSVEEMWEELEEDEDWEEEDEEAEDDFCDDDEDDDIDGSWLEFA